MDRIKVILICAVTLCFLCACSKEAEPERINTLEAGSEQVSQASAAATETVTKVAEESKAAVATEAVTMAATKAETVADSKADVESQPEIKGEKTENRYTDEKGYLILTGRGFETGEMNAYGVPELSGYTDEELYEMFIDPDHSEAEFYFNEPLPDNDDMEYDIVDEDFEPDWPEEEYRDLDISELFEDEGEGGYSEGAQGEYSYIFPDGVPKGLKESYGPEGYMITGTADKDTFSEIVGRLKDAGFTRNAEEMDISGITMFDAQNKEGKYATAMLMGGQLTVAITD